MIKGISDLFPQGPELFAEALEHCLLGSYGPTFDELVEYARETPAFRGGLLMACEELLVREWIECEQFGSRDQMVLNGIFRLAKEIPLDALGPDLRTWFTRHAPRLAGTTYGCAFGCVALSAIYEMETFADEETLSWWALLCHQPAWASKARQLLRLRREESDT